MRGEREREREKALLRRIEGMEKDPVAGNDDIQYSLRRLLLLTGRVSR